MAKTVEELEQELEALRAQIKRASASADDDDPGPSGRIPAARFATHRQQLRELAERVDGIQQQLGKTVSEVKGSYDRELKKARDEQAAAIEAESRRAGVDLELSDLGIKDPTIRKLVREHYQTIDEKARPETPRAFIEARRAAAEKAKADKSAAPDPIAWLDAYEAHVARARQQPATRRGAPPNIDDGAGPRGSEGFSVSDLDSMSPDALAKLAGIPVPTS
jgi:hypothetical protein